MIDLAALMKAFPLFVLIISVVIWFIRLEAKVFYLEKSFNDHLVSEEKSWVRLRLKLDNSNTNMGSMKETLIRIEEKLK